MKQAGCSKSVLQRAIVQARLVMYASRFRPLSRLLIFALAAAAGAACSLDTRPTGASAEHDGGGSSGHAGTGGGAGGGTGGVDTGGTGGTGGTAALGGAPNGGNAGEENCFDKKDNDGNGFVDCADPACANVGYLCKTSPPKGWEGYFRTAGDVYNTTTPPPKCPDGSDPLTYKANPGPPSCTPCTCGVLTNGCSPPRIDCAQNNNCAGATDWSAQFQSCNQAGYPSALSCKLEPPTPSTSGSCPASGGDLSVPDMFGRVLYACGASNAAGGGCVSGESCAAPASGAYSGSVCIRKAGEQDCPAGWGAKLVGYSDGTDTRSCSACTCQPNAASITCTGGAYTFYDHSICSCGLYPSCSSNKVVNSTACVDVSSLLDGSVTDLGGDWGGKLTNAPSGDGTCTPSGGQPTGAVQTVGAVTYCCL